MKLNFLSDLNKKIVFREYLIRLCIFFFLFLFFSMLGALVFLIPSYFLTNMKERAVSNRFEIINKTQEKSEGVESRLIIENTINKINLLSSEVSPISVYQLFEKVLLNKGSMIKINSFFYVAGRNRLGELKISGIAGTRESLLSFSKRLENEKIFKKVEVPISSLTKYKNLEFIISILGNF